MTMEEIKVGDIVLVHDWGESFSQNTDWFMEKYKENLIKPEWMLRWAYGDSSYYRKYNVGEDDTEYRVIFVDQLNDKALIEARLEYFPAIYLIGLDGLSKYIPPKKMTQREIENVLGYKIEIVTDKE